MNDSVNEYIRAWIGKADNDLKNAELVLAATSGERVDHTRRMLPN